MLCKLRINWKQRDKKKQQQQMLRIGKIYMNNYQLFDEKKKPHVW